MTGTDFPTHASAEAHLSLHHAYVRDRPWGCCVDGQKWGNLIRAYDIRAGWVTILVPIYHPFTGALLKMQAQTLMGDVKIMYFFDGDSNGQR